MASRAGAAPAGSEGQDENAAARKRRGVDYLLAAGSFIAVVLFVFRSSVDRQLSRLHAPGEKAFDYHDLHGADLADAYRGWKHGKEVLGAFEPIGARELVQIRSAAMTVSVFITALVLHRLVSRLRKPLLPKALVTLFAVASSALILVDLSVVENFERTSQPYGVLFPWLPWMPLAILGLLAPWGLVPLAKAIRNRYRTYRTAPASARLVFGVAGGFFGLANIGDIGAQIEDLMRRELTSRNGGGELWRALFLLLAVALYTGIVVLLATLAEKEGKAQSARSLLWAGGGITIAGALLVYLGHTTSAPLALGVVLLTIGMFSQGDEHPLFPRDEKWLRIATGFLVAGLMMVASGARFGHEPHRALLVIGPLAVAVGLVGLLVTWRYARSSGRRDEPLGVEGASAVVLAGIAVMACVPTKALVVHVGLGVAVLGMLLLVAARQWFRGRVWGLDVLAYGLVAAGIVVVRLHHSWSLGGALATTGLLVLRLLQGEYVQVGWGPKTETDLKLAPVRAGARIIKQEESRRGRMEPDEPPATRVLLLAAFLALAGLLVTSVRVLASVLATGGKPPLVLLLFQIALLALFPGLGWLIARAHKVALGRRWRAACTAVLVTVGAAGPVLALLSVGWFPAIATDIGSAVGPIFVLISAMAWLAALAGCFRLAFARQNQAQFFTRLGFERTPVIGLVLTWFVLTMVVGSPYELADATPHHVRLLERTVGATTPADCDDKYGVLATLRAGGSAADSPVAEELCRWVRNVMDLREDKKIPFDRPLPLILVSASGGGVRAAAWTTRVLDCLLFATQPDRAGSCPEDRNAAPTRIDRWPYVFAAGGASGGSVGIATAAAQWLIPTSARKPGNPDQRWARDFAEIEHVGPVFGQMLIAELGLSALGVVPEHDRAEVLIDGWSKPFGTIDPSRCTDLGGREIEQVGFLEVAARCPDAVPLLLFNGTIVRTGGRFDISPLDDPGSDGSLGLRDVLCREPENARADPRAEDVRFFDAAFLSARFPLVTPSGRIDDTWPSNCRPDIPSGADVVDGGYHENSGTAQIADVWNELRPLLAVLNRDVADGIPVIRPAFLQIENGEVDDVDGLGCVEPITRPNQGRADSGQLIETKRTEAKAGGDFSVRFGEPLRVAWAGFQARLRGRAASVSDPLIMELCAEDVPVITIALYGHPGRPLPLGWSLTGDVLDDLENVFALDPNTCRSQAFLAYVDGLHVSPGAAGCPPPEPRSDAGSHG